MISRSQPTSHNLRTCMMEGYDARRVKEILRPDRYGVPLMVATGYEYGRELPVHHVDEDDDELIEDGDGVSDMQQRTPRLEMNELFFGDTFGAPQTCCLAMMKINTLPRERREKREREGDTLAASHESPVSSIFLLEIGMPYQSNLFSRIKNEYTPLILQQWML